MTILLFAVLKEHFPPMIQTIGEEVTNIGKLKEYLTAIDPTAAAVLQACRFAVDNQFINEDFKIAPSHTIAVIPPSSGG